MWYFIFKANEYINKFKTNEYMHIYTYTNNQIKRFLRSLIIKEVQIKFSIRLHYTYIRMEENEEWL